MEAAKAALDQLGLDRLLIIPDREPPHKDLAAEAATPQQRLDMAALMADGLGPRAEASDLELRREGKSYTADTVEELAEATGMDAAKLQASIDAYNAVVRGEAEDEFGFTADNTADAEMTEGPWYACQKVPTVHHTMGGLKTNAANQVLDVALQVIPGLYAAGDCSGSVFANNYPEYIVGCACGRTITFSRHAVRHMAGDIA